MPTTNSITISAYTVARETGRRGTFKVFQDESGTWVDTRVGETHILFDGVNSARAFAYGILTALNEARLSA